VSEAKALYIISCETEGCCNLFLGPYDPIMAIIARCKRLLSRVRPRIYTTQLKSLRPRKVDEGDIYVM